MKNTYLYPPILTYMHIIVVSRDLSIIYSLKRGVKKVYPDYIINLKNEQFTVHFYIC